MTSYPEMQIFQAQHQPTSRPIEDRIAIAQPADNRNAVGVFDGTSPPSLLAASSDIPRVYT